MNELEAEDFEVIEGNEKNFHEADLIKKGYKRLSIRALDQKYNRAGKMKYYDIVGTSYRNYYYNKIRKQYTRVSLSGRRKLFTKPKAKMCKPVKMAKVREDYRKPLKHPIPPKTGKGYKPPFPHQNYKKQFDEDSPRRCHRPYFALYGTQGEYTGFFHSGGYYSADGNALLGITMWHPLMYSYRILMVDGQCSGIPTETGAIRSSSPMERHKLHDQITRQIPARPPVPAQRPKTHQEVWHNISKSIYAAPKYINVDKNNGLNETHYFRYRYSSLEEELPVEKLEEAYVKLKSLSGDALKKEISKILSTNPDEKRNIHRFVKENRLK